MSQDPKTLALPRRSCTKARLANAVKKGGAISRSLSRNTRQTAAASSAPPEGLASPFAHWRRAAAPFPLLKGAGFISVLGVCFLLLFANVLPAQRTTADVLGTVTDPSGAVLPDVKITVHSFETSADYTAESDSTGDYLVTSVPVGRYSITAVKSGFKTWTVNEVTLAIGDRLRQDVRLQLGTLGQSVEVTASSPALQSDSSSLSNLISTDAMQNLPLNGRNFV